MSRSALIISLLLVAALSIVGIALLIAPPAATASDASSLLRLDPSRVASIRVAVSDDASVITRTDAGGWLIHLESAGANPTAPWPAEPTQVRSIVRTLCDLRDASASGEPISQSVEPALTVTITMTGGDTHSVVFGSTPLGGRRLVEVDVRRTGEVDDAIYRAMTSPGPASWRISSPLHSVGERTSRVAVRTPGANSGVELAKIDGSWFIRQPIQSKASDIAAKELLVSLGALRIDHFIDDHTSITMTEAGLEAPRLLCTVEEDRRSYSASDEQIQTQTTTQTLAIGGPADLSGRLVYASINNGETFAVINIEPITSVSLAGEAYLAPSAAETIGSNIGAIAIRIAGQPEARYERDIEGWRVLDASGTALGQSPTEPIDALITALTQTPASSLTIEPPESYRPIASITLSDFAGGQLELLEAGLITTDVGANAPVIRSGQVFRVYEGSETPTLLSSGLR